jgi:hypothetical protein
MAVIGGGATGVDIAVDAVCLVEQSDFGKGTSSRSTKLAVACSGNSRTTLVTSLPPAQPGGCFQTAVITNFDPLAHLLSAGTHGAPRQHASCSSLAVQSLAYRPFGEQGGPRRESEVDRR